MTPHRIVLLGPPASGKGTQGRLMQERWKVPVVSAGDLLRSEIAANTALGQEAAGYMNHGGLVPDRVALAAVEGWLDTHGETFVFDGFPRTTGQAEMLDGILAARGRALTAVVWLEVDAAEIAHRVSRRVVCADCGRSFQVGWHVQDRDAACPACGGRLTVRTDDDPETLARRMTEYAEHTRPLKAYYESRGLLRVIAADQLPENVFDRICEATRMNRTEAIELA